MTNMKKYITPEVLCYEFETTNIIAESTISFRLGDAKSSSDSDLRDAEWDSRESNNNSNMWESGW